MNNGKIVRILLQVSLASVFLYAAVAATLEPYNWIGYIPQMARNLLPAQLLLFGFSFFQVVLSIWLFTGWKTVYAALLAAVTLLAIITVNFSQVDILFRDFAIFFAALALAVGSYKRESKNKNNKKANNLV